DPYREVDLLVMTVERLGRDELGLDARGRVAAVVELVAHRLDILLELGAGEPRAAPAEPEDAGRLVVELGVDPLRAGGQRSAAVGAGWGVTDAVGIAEQLRGDGDQDLAPVVLDLRLDGDDCLEVALVVQEVRDPGFFTEQHAGPPRRLPRQERTGVD